MLQKTVLENGIRILTERVPSSRIVSTGLWVEVGSRDEKMSNNGSAHFLEHMLFKGTQKRTARQISKELDMLGGMSNAFTSTETTCFYSSVIDTHLPLIVNLFADLFLNSVFSPAEIEREKQVILQEIGMVEDTPDDQIHDLFATLLWGEHPLGNTVLGYREVVADMAAENLVDFFKHFYTPENIIIAAAGNIDHQQFCELWEKQFGFLKNGQGRKNVWIRPDTFTSSRQVHSKALEQVHMVMGTYGLPVAVDDRYALHLLNIILGGNMSSRLFQEIREKRGLAYSVYSGTASFQDSGQISVYLGLGKESASEVLTVVSAELSRLKSDAVSDEELSNAKDYARGGLFLGAENMEARMTQLAKNEIYFNRHITIDEMLAGIDLVSCEDLTDLAGRIFSRPLTAVALGPVTADDIDWQIIN